MNDETWGHRPSHRRRTAVRVSSPCVPLPAPPGGRGREAPGYARNAAAAVLAGRQGSRLPGGRVEGCCQGVQGASLLASPAPQGPLVPGSTGRVAETSFGAVPAQEWELLVPGQGEAQTGWGWG